MQYLKFGVQVLATVLVAVVAGLTGDAMLTNQEIANVVIAGLGAIAVLGAGNLPAGIWKYTKAGVTAATAVAIYVASIWQGGGVITLTEVLQAAVVLIAALGLAAVPGPYVEMGARAHARRIG